MFVNTRQLLFVLIVFLSASGCQTGTNEIALTEKLQSAVFFVEPNWPNDYVVDASGSDLKMSDGVQVVLDAETFAETILPSLSYPTAPEPKAVVRVDADFELKKENVVIGVTQSADGATDERSKTYWVVNIKAIRTASWFNISTVDE